MSTSASAPGGLHAGRAGTDDHEVQRTLVDQLRVAVRVFEHREQARPETLGVVEGVERERVLLGTRGVEEVRLAAHRQHQVVARERDAVGARHGLGRRIDLGDVGHSTVTLLRLRKIAPQRAGHVGDVHLGRGDLVQQRLELVVVVPVDERDRARSCLPRCFAQATPANPPPTTTTGRLAFVPRPSATARGCCA